MILKAEMHSRNLERGPIWQNHLQYTNLQFYIC